MVLDSRHMYKEKEMKNQNFINFKERGVLAIGLLTENNDKKFFLFFSKSTVHFYKKQNG